MREPVYYSGYGYVTKDDEFQYVGNGIIIRRRIEMVNCIKNEYRQGGTD